MFVGVARRQEREEAFVVVDAEILNEDFRRARDVAENGSVMLHHPSRCAAGAAGVDDAGRIPPPDLGYACLHSLACIGGIAFEHLRPVVEAEAARLLAMKVFDADYMIGNPGRLQGSVQGAEQLLVRYNHRLRPRIVEDVDVIALGVGDIGGHSDAACGHDRQIGNAPFGAVFGDKANPVPFLQAQSAEALGKQADLIRRFAPADRLPFAVALGAEECTIWPFVGAFQEEFDKIVGGIDIRQHGQAPREYVLLLCDQRGADA